MAVKNIKSYKINKKNRKIEKKLTFYTKSSFNNFLATSENTGKYGIFVFGSVIIFIF